MQLELLLPYPPTVNTYWRRVGAKTLLSERARSYRREVGVCVLERLLLAGGKLKPFVGPVAVEIEFRPPDLRVRDLDNLPKGLLDALKHAGVYADDSQVRRLVLWWGPVRTKGSAAVTVKAPEVLLVNGDIREG